MSKKANNYMVIIIVLLLVVAIITGAGLCYLSWSDGYTAGEETRGTEAVQSTEVPGQTAVSDISSEELASAKEEGRQEILESIREELEADVSAEDILNGLLGIDATESSEEKSDAAEGESQESVPAEEPALSANTVTMADIQVTADGEYQYIKDGVAASHKGIDVSKYQETIDWAKVAANGVEYAFIRVGCRGYGSSGSLIKDETFHRNVKGALAQDIQVGAYFFSQAITVEEALEEADFVIQELEGYDITYPVAVDIECVAGQTARQDALTVAERTEICIAFCERIEAAGYIPMVYGNLETFAELLDAEQVAEYDFWICENDGDMTFPYEFAVWQYTHEGSVSGIKGNVNISISLKEW